jgi:hypothetical protein
MKFVILNIFIEFKNIIKFKVKIYFMVNVKSKEILWYSYILIEFLKYINCTIPYKFPNTTLNRSPFI